MWGVSRHADILAVEKDPTTFCNSRGYRPLLDSDPSIIGLDDLGHTARRSLVARRFTPKAVSAKEAAHPGHG